MSNAFEKLAEKIGVAVQTGGILNIENFNYTDNYRNTRPRSEAIFIQRIQAEVSSRLRQSLHNHIFIDLKKNEVPQQVKREWDFEVKLNNPTKKTLNCDETILEIFDRKDIQGRLLILGKPGSGKTTTLLELAQSLLNRATENPEAPIPVILGLSNWSIKQKNIWNWIVDELESKYSVRPDIYQKWLLEQKLLFLLDGLDEVKSDNHPACVQALNQWIYGDTANYSPGEIVVCSRIEEYTQIGMQLKLNAAVCLRQLSQQQIKRYLELIKKPELLSLISHNSMIMDLVSSPLFLSMFVIVGCQPIKGLKQLNQKKEFQSYLLDSYITKVLDRAKNYPRSKIRFWLIWIAKKMENEEETEFLVERIQPNSIQSMEIYYSLYRIMARLAMGLLAGIIVVPVFYILSPVFGITIGLIANVDSIEPIEGIYWNWKQAIKTPFKGLLAGIILGLFFGFIGLLQGYLFRAIIAGLMIGVTAGLLICLPIGLINGISSYVVEKKVCVNQGIWRSLKSGLLQLIITWIGFGLVGFIVMVVVGLVLSLNINTILLFTVAFGILPGLVIGLLLGLLKGFGVGLKHLILRIFLYASGVAPWNYEHFLVESSNCLILQQVGGRFRFIHKALQEQFAAMPLETPELKRLSD